MTETETRIGGAVIYWRLAAETSFPKLARGLRELGLDDFIPQPRTPLSCLRAVLSEMYKPTDKELKYVVRPVKNDHAGFAVVAERPKEHAAAGDNWGKVVVAASLSEETGEVNLDPFDWDQRAEILSRMENAAEWLPVATVGKTLIGLVEKMGGVTLRENGGIYWLDKSELTAWARIGDVVEAASSGEGKPSHVYTMKVVADEQMVRAVGDALASEVESAVAMLESELEAGDLQEQACLNRIKRIAALSEKVGRYEAAFREPLPKLQEACQRAVSAAAMAALQNSASTEGAVLV